MSWTLFGMVSGPRLRPLTCQDVQACAVCPIRPATVVSTLVVGTSYGRAS